MVRMDLTAILTSPPEASECAPYYVKYFAVLGEGNILDTLERQRVALLELLASIPEARAGHRYAPGKWTIREAVGHVTDTERMFAYRALRISRGDRTPIEGFDQDSYVAQGPADRTPLALLAEEFDAVRRATLALFRQLDAEAWLRRGIANQNEVSVRALAWITAGHDLHHRGILRDKYLA